MVLRQRLSIRANSPAPAGQTYGKTSKRWIDSYGRLEKEAVLVNGAEQYYTRREFPTNGVQSKTHSTIVDTNISTNPGPDSADEVYSESWSDGAGRMRMSRTEHPGSTGGWTASQVEYDLLGRVKRQSVPTEVSVSGSTWTPSGDDATRGWLWTYQKYDWKGRVVRKINTDGADSSSERVPIPNTSNYARRKQKIYEDILGRGYKTETFEWDGTTLYTTTEQTFNGRDQVVNTRQTDNTSTASPQTHQDVAMTYDGFGRMKTRHYPIEDSAAATTWNYNPDGSIAQIVDPRNAITDFTYNSRGLATQIAYTPASGSSMPDAPTVSFGYDALGNRTSMDTAGVSETTYTYNSLSQMTSETVNFDDLSNDLTIGYTYNLSGGLSSVTDPFGESVDYTNDKTGRLTAVGGTPFGDNTTGDYASGIQYRAFGQVKQMTYETDDNAVVSMQYDNRLRVSQHQVASGEYSGGYLKKAEFVYYSDSKPKEMDDQVDAVFDRKFEYDFAGRLSRSEFGLYTTQQNTQLNPHMQDVAYDAFSQVTSRETEQWGSAASFGRTYVNGRMAGHSGETLTYDAAGNITYTGVSSNKFQDTVYDAAGRRTSYTERWIITGSSNSSIVSERVLSNKFDGAGQLVKSTNQLNRISSPASTGDVTNTYTVHSSVLGGALSEISYVGESVIKRKTSIYAGGAIIAEQRRLLDDETVVYFHADPVTGSKQEVRQTGESIDTREGRQEVEPFGQSIRTTPPFEEEPPANPVPIVGDSLFPEWQCALPTDLIPTHCALKMIADIKGGGLWLGPTSTKNKEGNIANLSHESSHSDPGRGGVALAANNALSSAVTATTKPAEQEDGCSYGTDGGQPNCNVQSLPAASDPIEANNAEFKGLGQTMGIKLRLVESDQRKYEKTRTDLVRRLDDKNISENCRELLDTAGLSLKNVVEAVNLQNAYDGSKSTVSMFVAGGIDESSWNPGLSEANRQATRDRKIDDYFANETRVQARTMFNPGGSFAATVAGRSDVYFRTDANWFNGKNNGFSSQTTILHEALHSLTGLTDQKLYTLLTGMTTDHDGSSMGISQALRDAGCTK